MNIAFILKIYYWKATAPTQELQTEFTTNIGIFVSMKIGTKRDPRLNTDDPPEPAMNFTQRPSILPVTLTGHGTVSCRY